MPKIKNEGKFSKTGEIMAKIKNGRKLSQNGKILLNWGKLSQKLKGEQNSQKRETPKKTKKMGSSFQKVGGNSQKRGEILSQKL